MNRLKHIAKGAMGKALLRTGAWKRHLKRMAQRSETIVLTYHRVIEKWDRALDYSQPGMVVTADTFDRQLLFLKKYFDIVPLSSLINSDFGFRNSDFSGFPNPDSASSDVRIENPKSQIPNSKFARPLCALTFDDGWRDNYEIAFPILRKHAIPATIFLTTDFIGTDRAFWHAELIYLFLHGELTQLRRTRRDFEAYPASIRPHLIRLARMTQAPSGQSVNALIEKVKHSCDQDVIEEMICDLAPVLRLRKGLLRERRFFLEWEHVRDMAAAGVEIGSHGCSHRILTRLKPEEAKKELVESKVEIEQRIGQGVQHFAFPEGVANRHLMKLVEKAGYRTACLCRTLPDDRRLGPLAVQRIGMHESVSSQGDGSFSEALLASWLIRVPRMRIA